MTAVHDATGRMTIRSAWHLGWMGVLHHVAAAVMLASLMWFLEGRHVLEWLDGAMLRVTGSNTQSELQVQDPGLKARPTIIDIDGNAYRTVFGERSPLDRNRLQELLLSLPLDAGKVLAIDIDLSPAVHEDNAAARPLDQLLDRLARSGMAVVLVLPDPSEDNLNLGWIRARCGAGIHFASAAITERMGAVTRVDASLPTLAAVTLALARDREGEPRLHAATLAPHADGLPGQLCRSAAHASGEYALFNAAREPAHHDGHAPTLPLHPMAAAMRYLTPTVSDVVLTKGRAGLANGAALRPVIFLGGSYDIHDTFRTVEGAMPGLYVHAASFASLRMQTAQVGHFGMFLIDIGLGFLLGWLFGGMWNLFGRADRRASAALQQPTAGAAPVAAFLASRLMLVLFWMVPVAIAAGFAAASHSLLVAGWWANPGPVILGMFLHAMSLRHEHEHHDKDNDPRPFWRRMLSAHPDTVLVQLPLTVLLLAAVTYFH